MIIPLPIILADNRCGLDVNNFDEDPIIEASTAVVSDS